MQDHPAQSPDAGSLWTATVQPPTGRLILIAWSKEDGRDWISKQPALREEDVIIVTPRSPDAARGCTADAVLAVNGVEASPSYQHMVEVSLPAVMARADRKPAIR
jgi:hypothetical protein